MRPLALLLPLVLAASAAAQGPHRPAATVSPVAAAAPGPDTLRAEAGGTVGFGVRLDEPDGVAQTVRLGVEAPPGWRPLLPGPTVALAAGGSALRIVSLQVAADARAGVYRVTVRVRDGDGAETLLSKAIRVEARAALTVVLADPPRFAIAGEAYALRALVRNGGTGPAEVRVRARSSLGSAVEPDETVVAVEAGATAEVVVSVRTEPRASAARDRLRVTAVQLGAPGVVGEALATVEVVPRGSTVAPAGPPPLMGTVAAVGLGGELRPRLGLAGTLPLGAGHAATVRLDGLGPASASAFARAPEAWVRYEAPGGEAFVGTGTFELTPVTSAAAFGFGAQGRAEVGRAELTALARWPWLHGGTERSVDLGLGAERSVGDWGRIGAHALAATGLRGGEVLTVRAEGAGAGLEASAEVGAATGGRPVYGLRLAGARGPLALAAAADRRDAAQPGRLASETSEALTGRLRLTPGASLWGSWRQSGRGAGRSAVVAPAQARTARGGVRWAGEVGGLGLRATAGGQHRHTRRAGAARALTLGEAALDLSSRRLTASADLGAGRTALPTGSRPAWTARGGLGLHTRFLDLSASHAVSDGTSVWAAAPTRQWSTALDAALRLGGLGLRGSLTTGRFEADLGALGGRVATGSRMVRVEATMPAGGGREVVLAGLHYGAAGTRATHLEATLRVPVPVPLPAVDGRPEIHGRIVDGATGAGVPGVLVYHGEDRVVTDGDGAFAFATTPAGGVLFLDRATLGADRVPRQAFPLAAVPGEPVRVEVVRRVVLRGALRRMAVYGAGARADTSDVGGVAQAVVEATGEGQRHRAVTDAEGRFHFDDLPAGRYALALVGGALPERHRLAQETLTVTVDSVATVLWQVVPDRREIRMMGGTAAQRLSAGGLVRVAARSAPEVVRPEPQPVAEAPVRTVVAGAPAAAHERLLRAQAARGVTAPVEQTPTIPASRPVVHRAEIGEHLLAIARRFGVPEAEIRALNPGLGDHLAVGQPVRLRPGAVRPTIHLARPGEHLLSIGRAHGLSAAEIRALNPGLGDHLAVGQPVRVAGAASLPATHRVAPGEYLLAIARRYGLSEAEIRALNPGLGDLLRVGQEVRLRASAPRRRVEW